MSDPVEPAARRFVHICYCCDDADVVTDFFVQGLRMKNTMRTPDEYGSGEILGIDRMIRSLGSFVYDQRGPRVSPAIEVQAWFDPAPVGEPSTDPFEIGIKALGIAVPSLSGGVADLLALGCRVVADAAAPSGERQITLLDARDVTLDLVEDAAIDAAATRLHHLRVTVSDLDRSVGFYVALGFDVVERGPLVDARFVGVDDPVDGEWARLRLPDEPFELRLHQWSSPAGHGRHYAEPFHRGIFRAALAVDDTRGSYDRLTEAGMDFDRPPMQYELHGTPVPDMWITFVSDPDGIPFEFVQRPRSAFRQ